MLLRPATITDLPAIFGIYHEQVLCGFATFDTAERTPEQQNAWWQAHPAADYPVFVACDDENRVLGWASLSRWSDRNAYDRTAEVSEYIHKDCRGRGIGGALLSHAIEAARARGRGVLLARMSEGNPASVRLHEAVGFVTVGVMHGVGEKFGVLRDVRIMEMQLGAAPRANEPRAQ